MKQIDSEELIRWLKTERLEDEASMINARDHGEWDRYHSLEGHCSALLHVINHVVQNSHEP